MSEPITVTGMVLSSAPMGEYDRRVVLLTRERGKVTAFARGARKSTSAILAASNTFVFGKFQLYEGRTSYSLNQASISHSFSELAMAQPEVYFGFYFLEFADYYSREGIDGSQMLNLLFITIKALLNNKLENELIRVIFELKAMVINGEYPQLFACLSCSKQEHLTGLDIPAGGVVCQECQHLHPNAIAISASALYTMQYIVATPLEKLFTFTVTAEVLRELKQIMKDYLGWYTDKKFKTLEILKMMC